MELQELKELNLTQGQIRVYEAILDIGKAGIHNIQEKTGLERRAIYDILNKLTEKGLVTFTLEKGVKSYQLTHPKHLREAIEQKQQILEELEDKLPLITSQFEAKKKEVHAEVYRGNDAMKALLNEALNYEATYWIGGNSGVETCTEEMRLWFKRWTIKRVEAKRFMYDLVDKGTHLEDFLPKDITKHKKAFLQILCPAKKFAIAHGDYYVWK